MSNKEKNTTKNTAKTSTTKEETTIPHTVTKEDVASDSPGKDPESFNLKMDPSEEAIPISEDGFTITPKFAEALDTYHKTLPAGYTVSVFTDGAPNLEVISFDKSIPNTQKHIENLRLLLVRNNNVYGNHKRFVGTEKELIKQLNGTGE